MNFPPVEIIILNFNRRDDTIECLASLAKIDYPRYHITLLDNGSKDGLGDAIHHKFSDIRYIYSPVNLRFAGGNNKLIEQALAEGYELILLLNNDTVVSTDFLTKMVEAAMSDAKIGAVGAKMMYYDQEDIIWFAGGIVDIRRAYMRHFGIGKKDQRKYNHPGEVSFLNGACMLVKSAVFRDIGLLDEGFFLYGEDLDFCLRATAAGWKLYYEPSAKIWHKVSRSVPTAKKMLYRYQSWFRIIRKHSDFRWRPIQLINLSTEFVPLAVGYIRRMTRFARRRRRGS